LQQATRRALVQTCTATPSFTVAAGMRPIVACLSLLVPEHS
jgi:hypothetical protein